jgi:hypothetical protein
MGDNNLFIYPKPFLVMKKTIVFFLSFFAHPLNAQGGSFSCGNEETSNLMPTSTLTFDYDDWLVSNSFNPQSTNPIFSSSYSVPIHIVVVAKDDGTLPPLVFLFRSKLIT